jgi:hypothetical protein
MRQALAMARPAVAVPADLRARLEAARLHLDLKLMLRDTLASLEQLPELSARFRRNLPRRAHLLLAQLELTVRQSLLPAEAYNMVPGRDPQNG